MRALFASGITPACAGKSEIEMDQQRLAEDHPRVCGEKSPQAMAKMEADGSPPRVRGKD